ncbi:G10 protein-domain-containing protein [Helicostylum pulchrum]|nr:G10 protein-domain-containing protein [Helicostylum pulchrum]
MPKIRTTRTKRAPEGFDEIEPTLEEFAKKMKEVENESHEGKRIVETTWPVFRIHHQRSRYIYDLYYKRKLISRDLYDYLIKNKYADANLIAKWKKSGFEKLCCLRCIQPKDTNFGTTCICRVPKEKLEDGKMVEYAHRRQIIKRKVLAIGKMSRSYTVLKEHPELVKQLKTLTVNGKLPVGTLATGEQGIREGNKQNKTKNPVETLKEQKDLSSYHVVASPNYKVASREGHA